MKQYPKSPAAENGLAKIVSIVLSAVNVISIMILTFCLILGLSACGGNTSGGKNSERTENQISSDVQAQDDYFNTYGLKVDSFSISKRQTNREDKTDFVWCAVTASNNVISYSAEYKLTYVLYNDGWLLEEYAQDSSSIIPKSMPTQTVEEAMALVVARFEQRDQSDITEYHVAKHSALKKEDDFTYVYYFQIIFKTTWNSTIPDDYSVTYRFDLASGQWNSEVEPTPIPLWWD